MSKNKSKKPKLKAKSVNKAAKKVAPKKVAKMASKKPLKVQAKALKKPAKLAKTKEKIKLQVAPKLSKAETKAEIKAAIKATMGAKDAQKAVVEEVKEDVALTNADGKRYCKVSDCDEIEAIDSYCRLHYIMYWKRNKTKTKILEGGKLDKYIEELTQRYPDKYLEMLKKDLASEKDFNGIIAEMDAEDAADDVDAEEEDNRFIEEVRGTTPTGAADDDDGGF